MGNFGDGKINAYNPVSGMWLGDLKDAYGNEIEINGLWGLMVGNGGKGGDTDALYFTAGINNGNDGLLGLLQADPVIAAVFQSASYLAPISPERSLPSRAWTLPPLQGAPEPPTP